MTAVVLVCRPSTAVGCPEKVGKMKQEDFEECKAEAIRKDEAYKKNHSRPLNWPPFPLPDIYDSDDPWLIGAACEALQRIRRNYVLDLGCNGKWLTAATDIAFDVRSAWLHNGLAVLEVPLAENPRWPTEQDFARLEQWFVTLAAQVARDEIEPTALNVQSDEPPLEGDWSKPMSKNRMMAALGMDSIDTFNLYAERQGITSLNRSTHQIRLDQMDAKTRGKLENA